jgi:hypothetical protein
MMINPALPCDLAVAPRNALLALGDEIVLQQPQRGPVVRVRVAATTMAAASV